MAFGFNKSESKKKKSWREVDTIGTKQKNCLVYEELGQKKPQDQEPKGSWKTQVKFQTC